MKGREDIAQLEEWLTNMPETLDPTSATEWTGQGYVYS